MFYTTVEVAENYGKVKAHGLKQINANLIFRYRIDHL